jgi:hypothetical protein
MVHIPSLNSTENKEKQGTTKTNKEKQLQLKVY